MKHLPTCTQFSFDGFLYNTCQVSKCHRLAFKDSITSISHAFELVCSDLSGPYKTHSITGDSYVLTIVDEFSKSIWTYFQSSKINAIANISHFIQYVHNQFGFLPKCFRTDSGKEFFNHDCSFLLAKHGIIYQRSLPYTAELYVSDSAHYS